MPRKLKRTAKETHKKSLRKPKSTLRKAEEDFRKDQTTSEKLKS